MCSKREYWNTRYFELEGIIDKLWSETRTYSHKGEPTKRMDRLVRLTDRKRICDKIRWSTMGMPKRLVKALEKIQDYP